jgi:hypothetical protein
LTAKAAAAAAAAAAEGNADANAEKEKKVGEKKRLSTHPSFSSPSQHTFSAKVK